MEKDVIDDKQMKWMEEFLGQLAQTQIEKDETKQICSGYRMLLNVFLSAKELSKKLGTSQDPVIVPLLAKLNEDIKTFQPGRVAERWKP